MTRFDYLRSGPPLRLGGEVVERWRIPAAIAVACVAFLAGTWMMQAKTLDEALRTQRSYQSALQASQLEVSRSRARYRSITALLRLRARAREIEFTSRSQAQTFFRLAEAVPDHVWLTSVTRDGNGLLVSGQARSYDGVAQLLAQLSGQGLFRRPALSSAALTEDRSKPSIITYQLHVDLDATHQS